MCGWSRLIACPTRPAHPGPNCFVCGPNCGALFTRAETKLQLGSIDVICSTDVMQ